MTPKEALDYILTLDVSKYRIAKVMDVHSTIIDKIIEGQQKTIRREAADNLKVNFNVEINDNYINGYQKRMFIDKHNNLDSKV